MSNDQIQNPEEEAAEVVAAPSIEKTTKSSKKAASPSSDHEDFDWDADEAGFQTYNSDEKKKLEAAMKQAFASEFGEDVHLKLKIVSPEPSEIQQSQIKGKQIPGIQNIIAIASGKGGVG